jgi:YD repeat-containing protein
VMDYDSKGQMLSMKDGLGNVIQAFTYYGNGLTKTETDSSGTSQYFYDDLGNLTRTVDPDGSATLMEYDFNGKLKRMVEDNGTPNDTTDDEVSVFDYDKLGREKLADYGDGIWVKYDYEGAGGDWSKLEAPTIGKMERKLTADGKLAGWVTPDGGTPTFIYDSAGRLWKETDATGQVTTEYTYDQVGRVSSVKDVQTGAVASKKYDLGDRVTEEIDPLLGFVRYEYYDARNGGKLKSTTRGQYIRNAAGNLVEDTTVALQTTSYEYNGSRTTVIDPLGRRTTAVQDEYALPTETIFENRNGKDYKTSQSYLYANNLQEAKDYPTRIVDIAGNDRKYTYDTTGRLETATDLGDGVYTYTYDENGLSILTSPNNETLKYGYDDLGNLSKITYGDGTVKYFVSKVEK